MRFAVNVNMNKKAITGWASTSDSENLANYSVHIFRKSLLIGTAALDIQRDDVMLAGLHPTGKCGFQFSSQQLNLIEGSIYRVEIICADKCKSMEVLYGDKASIVKAYDAFELLRDDFSILAIPTTDILNEDNELIAFKKLLIRLRRGKRAHAWRQSFKGENYQFIQQDWHEFRKFFEDHIALLLSVLSVRHIWSVIDTFADYAVSGERLAALAISNFMYQERFAQTYKCIYNFTEKSQKVTKSQLNYWGGMKTNRLESDDACDVFITRNLECLNDFPLMRKIFIHILRQMFNEEGSVIGENVKHSQYFSSMAEFYKKNLG